MNITCKDLDRILQNGTPAEWAALEAHARACAGCTDELRAWKSLSVAAQEMRDYAESSTLWPRIECALAEEADRAARGKARRGWFSFLPRISMGWQAVLAGAFVLILSISAGWVILHQPKRPDASDSSLLKSQALQDVENAEAAYEKAIDKLAVQAKPQLDDPASPLLANYHEKLLVLDSAIAELRAQAGLNPSNAQLRYQLLAMYQEKQRTLEEVLEARQ